METTDHSACGISYDHTLLDGHTECRECGADLAAWVDGEDDLPLEES